MILANIFSLGNPVEIGIIAVVALVLFGGTKIAGFGKSLGDGLREFKKATHDETDAKDTGTVKAVSADVPTADSTKKVD